MAEILPAEFLGLKRKIGSFGANGGIHQRAPSSVSSEFKNSPLSSLIAVCPVTLFLCHSACPQRACAMDAPPIPRLLALRLAVALLLALALCSLLAPYSWLVSDHRPPPLLQSSEDAGVLIVQAITIPQEPDRLDQPKRQFLFALPSYGPNNQYLGYKDTMVLAKILGRVFVPFTFMSHYSYADYSPFKNFSDVFNATGVREYVDYVPMSIARSECNATLDSIISMCEWGYDKFWFATQMKWLSSANSMRYSNKSIIEYRPKRLYDEKPNAR